MTVAFTLCSNNYLAQAKVLSESFKKHHPEIELIIGLVDTVSQHIDYSSYNHSTILPVSDLQISDFEELEKKYSVVELNTTVKPFYFSYLFNNRHADKIIYLDPDTEVFSPFDEVFDLLDAFNIILTPQNCVPIDDGNGPCDIHILGTGIFNLGFIALSNAKELESFLEWWTQRLIKYGFADERNNMFFDQVWLNLVPVFFDNYYILKHPGYNMSPSNLHERQITNQLNENYIVNKLYPLRFYHYSGYRFLNPSQICSYSERYTFNSRPDIVPIYNAYLQNLYNSNICDLSNIIPAYGRKQAVNINKDHRFKRGLKRVRRALNVLSGRE